MSGATTPSSNQNAAKGLGLSKERYNLSEMMFGMERGGCTVAQANQDVTEKDCGKGSARSRRDSGDERREGMDLKDKAAAAKNPDPPADTSKTGQAPWQEGVLERLVQELTPQEYNMYVVHHGRMLLAFGQIEACTPREKDFVYGSLEPIPVQTLRSFKVTIVLSDF